jgi:hypothetical protein
MSGGLEFVATGKGNRRSLGFARSLCLFYLSLRFVAGKLPRASANKHRRLKLLTTDAATGTRDGLSVGPKTRAADPVLGLRG